MTGQPVRASLAEEFKRIMDSEVSEETKTALFMAACVSQNYQDYVSAMQPLYEQAQAENERLRAELVAVRRRVRRAYAGPYLPSPEYVLNCLNPTPGEVATEAPARIR